MGRVQAWQCPTTGTLFADESEYRAWRSRVNFGRTTEQRRQQARDAAVRALAPLYLQPSFDDIEDWINANPETFWQFHLTHGGRNFWRSRNKGKSQRELFNAFRLSNVELYNMKWNDECRTTHSAPKGLRTTGWKQGEISLTYPGWNGRIYYEVSGFDSFPYRLFEGTGINPMGGGTHVKPGRPKTGLSFDITLFACDWPELIPMMRADGRTGFTPPNAQPLPVPATA